ncbi:MAG: hypothetical protein OEY14_18395, partial [Myxococcales bacterium]|nr:hypothetical protein [Myxococcales bacterium]
HLGRLIEGIFEARPGAGGEGGLRRDSLIFDFDPITAGIAGYAWIFPMPGPRGAGLWKVGMMDGRGRSSGGALRGWLSAFAERSGLRPAEGKVGGWPERFFQPGARAHRPGLCLVGDAWGVDPLLGEGLAPSLEMSRFAARRLKRALDRGRSSLGAYALAFLNTEEGRNLSFQRLLANRLYGRHPFRWMRALFSNAELRRRAGSGQEAYGRLLPLAPRLLGSFAEQVLREGMPPNAAPSSEARSLSACPRPDA